MGVTPKRLVFLASGRGSNFEAIARAIQAGELQAEASALICNRREAPVLKIAEGLGVPACLVDRKRFKDRLAYEEELISMIETFDPDLVCLAGYMLLLGPKVVQRWKGKIVNIHPSLLPDFRGLNAQKQALESGRSETGCTVHYVTEGLDDGPIIEQSKIAILPGDTEQSLSERLLAVEHATYVRALRKIL